jgi:hypothetical protein
MMKMFQSNNNLNQLSVNLRMPAFYRGKAVPTSIVVMELLWQQYGLDLLHPEVSRWLEQNAPDVRSAAANGQFAHGEVGPQGNVELLLPLEIDDRLRAVSSQYILSQIEHSTELPLAA